jgi:hypothetical protein
MKRIRVPEYIQEIRRVEQDIKATKIKMHQSGYQSDFDWNVLYRLKAEATRLYALRTEFRAHKHPVKGGWYLAPRWDGKIYPTYIPIPDEFHPVCWDEDTIRKAVLHGEPGWELPYLEEVPLTPAQQILDDTLAAAAS